MTMSFFSLVDGRGIDDEVVVPVHGNFDAAPLPHGARSGGEFDDAAGRRVAGRTGELAARDARRDGDGRDGRRRHVRRRLRLREERREREEVEEEARPVVRRQPVAQRETRRRRTRVLRFRSHPRLQ